MLHILWMILKILLIVILCILGILLTVTALVLFVPIRYRVHAEKADEMEAMVKVSWLLHAISLRAGWREKGFLLVRLFGITIYDRNRQKKEKSIKEKPIKEKPIKAKRQKEKTKEPESENPEKNNTTETETVHIEQEQNFFEKIWTRITGFFRKIADFFRMLIHKLKNIRYTTRKFCDKIKGMAEQASCYKEVLEREETKRAFSQCKKQLYRIWKNIRPKKLSVYLHFGADDPYTTGQIMAYYGMFYPWIYPYVTVEPEFEREVTEGRFDCRGRITIFAFIAAAVKIYFDKDIRYLIGLFKKEDSGNGGK